MTVRHHSYMSLVDLIPGPPEWPRDQTTGSYRHVSTVQDLTDLDRVPCAYPDACPRSSIPASNLLPQGAAHLHRCLTSSSATGISPPKPSLSSTLDLGAFSRYSSRTSFYCLWKAVSL